jgi:hypothetical protein
VTAKAESPATHSPIFESAIFKITGRRTFVRSNSAAQLGL